MEEITGKQVEKTWGPEADSRMREGCTDNSEFAETNPSRRTWIDKQTWCLKGWRRKTNTVPCQKRRRDNTNPNQTLRPTVRMLYTEENESCWTGSHKKLSYSVSFCPQLINRTILRTGQVLHRSTQCHMKACWEASRWSWAPQLWTFSNFGGPFSVTQGTCMQEILWQHLLDWV